MKTINIDDAGNLQSTKKDYLINAFTVLSATCILIIFCVLCKNILPQFISLEAHQEKLYKLFYYYGGDGFTPEPIESVQYMGCVFLSPFLLFGFRLLYARLLKNTSKINILYLAVSSICAVAIGFMMYYTYNVQTDYSESTSLYLRDSYALNHVAGFIVILLFNCFMLFIILKYKRENSSLIKVAYRIFDIICIFLVLSVFFLYFMGFGSVVPSFRFENHFEAVFYSVSQVFGGKGMLIDVFSQYGLYPAFLEPIFKVFGLNVLSFTFVMALLVAGCYICFFIFFKKLGINKYLAFIGFLSIFFFYNMSAKYILPDKFELYYQYTPIRLVFPSLLIMLTPIYFKNADKRLYYFMMVLFASGVLWNFDSGVVTFAALILTLCYYEILKYDTEIKFKKNAFSILKKCLFHILIAIAAFILVLAVFCIYSYARYGQLPQLMRFLDYQKIFYSLGFLMLPMPLFHPWMLLAILCLVGLVKSISCIFTKKDKYTSIVIFMLSVLSAGLFSYYQGRSHDLTFLNITYLGFILATIFMDKILKEIRMFIKHKEFPFGRVILFICLFAFLLSGALGIFDMNNFKSYYKRVASQMQQIDSPREIFLNNRIKFVEENTSPKQEVLILCEYQGYLYAYSKTTNPVKIPGLIELLLKSDINTLVDYVANTPPDTKIFLSDRYKESIPGMYNIIENQYKLISSSQDGQVNLYKKIE